MLDGIRHNVSVWKMTRDLSKHQRMSDAKYAAAKASNASEDDLMKLTMEDQMDTDLILDELQTLHSQYLRSKAEVLDVPVPDFSMETGEWEQSRVTGRYILSSTARHKLREQIRATAKAEREAATWWIPLIFAFVFGLVGAFTGLIAVWDRHHSAQAEVPRPSTTHGPVAIQQKPPPKK